MKLARFALPLMVIFILGVVATSAGAASKPNLKVRGVTASPSAVVVGGSISVSATTVNTGRGKAKRSSTSFVLRARRNQESDTQDLAKKTVKSLKKGGKKTLTITVTIPAGLAPGGYFVGACADGTSKVKESKETDNCTFAKSPITVSALPTSVNEGTPAGSAPVNTELPSITGAPGIGLTLTALPGTWTPAGTFLLRSWLRCTDNTTLGSCTVIAGAEGATYTPVAGDENKFIRLRVTGTNASGSTVATSAATETVVPDTDGDGTLDTVDCAPSDTRLPGAGHPGAPACVGTIYGANDGTGVDGAVIALSNVLITADDGGSVVYAQVKSGDAGFNGVRFSGIEVHQALGRTKGERVNIYGTLDLTAHGAVVIAESIVVQLSGEATFPSSITFTEFAVDTLAYDATLVSLPGIPITSVDSAGWHLDLAGTPMLVTNPITGTLPPAVAGQQISTLTGIAESYDSNLKLMPRTADDVLLSPLGCGGLNADSVAPPTTDC